MDLVIFRNATQALVNWIAITTRCDQAAANVGADQSVNPEFRPTPSRGLYHCNSGFRNSDLRRYAMAGPDSDFRDAPISGLPAGQ